MTRPQLPTADEVRLLPHTVETTVTADKVDYNGHMNVRYYLDFAATGFERAMHEYGITDDYRSGRRMGVFAVEHHLRYLSELRLDTAVTVHPRVLARSAQAAHAMSYLVDATRGVLAYTLEVVFVHVSMDTRRAAPFPDDIAAGFDAAIAAGQALPWSAPVCGTMGVRPTAQKSVPELYNRTR